MPIGEVDHSTDISSKLVKPDQLDVRSFARWPLGQLTRSRLQTLLPLIPRECHLIIEKASIFGRERLP